MDSIYIGNGVEFDFTNASKIFVNDGCIKCIYVENSDVPNIKDNYLHLEDQGSALIEFENGKKMIITNSEWASLHWIAK